MLNFPQCEVIHSYLFDFFPLSHPSVPSLPFFNVPHISTLCRVPNEFHSDTMRSIVTIGFSHRFIGPIRGPMLLSCWRNVIRPRRTVNIHISGPLRNMRQGCFHHIMTEETRFICISWGTKVVTVWCKCRIITFWVKGRNIEKALKPERKEADMLMGNQPIFAPCSQGCQPLWTAAGICAATLVFSFKSALQKENPAATYKR